MPDKSDARKTIADLLKAKDTRSKQQGAIERARVEFEKRTNPPVTDKSIRDVFKLVDVYHSDDPEELKRVGVAETPALISPMIRSKQTCPTCKAEYGPLFYGVGHTTRTAHEGSTCPGIFTTPDAPVEKIIRGGGALLTGQLSEDERKFTGSRAHYLACSRCSHPDVEGTITTQGYVSCSDCARETHPIEWSIDEGDLRFMFRPGALKQSQAMDRYLKGQEEVGRMQPSTPKTDDPLGIELPAELEERIKRMQRRNR